MNNESLPDYYEDLQISPIADLETIERVFRLLAKRYHPDNKDTGNADVFNRISSAYEVLADAEKRASYDARFEAGQEPELFDKEFVRLAYNALGYRGDGEPPLMPDSLWLDASQLYISSYEQLTGQEFRPGEYPVEPRLLQNLRKAGYIR